MNGLFIPGITAEMFRNGCLESIDALMADGEIYDIDYSPWIPVSKRLPDEGHVVYCQLIDGSHEILFLDIYSDGQMAWVGRRMGDYKVTAWRELPESYKENGEKGAE